MSIRQLRERCMNWLRRCPCIIKQLKMTSRMTLRSRLKVNMLQSWRFSNLRRRKKSNQIKIPLMKNQYIKSSMTNSRKPTESQNYPTNHKNNPSNQKLMQTMFGPPYNIKCRSRECRCLPNMRTEINYSNKWPNSRNRIWSKDGRRGLKKWALLMSRTLVCY